MNLGGFNLGGFFDKKKLFGGGAGAPAHSSARGGPGSTMSTSSATGGVGSDSEFLAALQQTLGGQEMPSGGGGGTFGSAPLEGQYVFQDMHPDIRKKRFAPSGYNSLLYRGDIESFGGLG